MNQPEFAEHDVFVTMRIPATWEHPREMLAALPKDCRFSPEHFVSNDGTEFDLSLRDPDDQFVGIFASQCRREPTDEEKRAIENYTVQICLTARCGTKRSAAALCHAINIFLDAGAWGVFVDNSGVAFAKTAFQEIMNEIDASDSANSDPLSFAFVSIVGAPEKAYTIGMQILGYPDIDLSGPEPQETTDRLVDVLRYVSSGTTAVSDGSVG